MGMLSNGSMNLPLGYLPDNVFFDRISTRPASVDALLKFMDFPGMPGSVSGLSVEEKLEKAQSQALHLKNQLPEYKHLSVEDILMCECYQAFTNGDFKIPGDHFEIVFGPTDEHETTRPVARYFHGQGYTVFAEVPIGKSRADLIAYKREDKSFLVAVELKTKVAQLKKCFAQLMDYGTVADEVYLATTPGCVIKYLTADIDEINPHALEEELHKCGAGLLILDGGADRCSMVVEAPASRGLRSKTRDWLDQRCEAIISEEVPIFPWSD